jgi:ribosomal protein S6
MEDKKNKAIESNPSGASKETGESRIYEVGFHIVPIVAEENLSEETTFIRDAITNAGGEIISEGAPSKMKLAYAVDVEVGGDRKTFNTSYFGWIKFELLGENLEKVKKALDLRENVLRHLIVKTIREDTIVPRESSTGAERQEAVSSPVAVAEEPKELTEDDKKAIDESIEELVSE